MTVADSMTHRRAGSIARACLPSHEMRSSPSGTGMPPKPLASSAPAASCAVHSMLLSCPPLLVTHVDVISGIIIEETASLALTNIYLVYVTKCTSPSGIIRFARGGEVHSEKKMINGRRGGSRQRSMRYREGRLKVSLPIADYKTEISSNGHPIREA